MEAIIIFFVIMSIMWGIQAFLQQLTKGPQQGPPGERRETPIQSVMRMLEEAQQQAQQQERGRQQPPARAHRVERVQQLPQVAPPARSQPVLRARPVGEEHGGKLKERHLKSKVAGRRLKSKVADRHLKHRIHSPGAHGTDGAAAHKPDVDPGEELLARLERLRPLQRAIALQEIMGEPRSVQWMRKRQA